jgi:hypothetical protein
MRIEKLVLSLFCAAIITGCRTPEGNAWVNGITREEAMEIRTSIRAYTSARVHSYQRAEDGTIHVSTEGDGIWIARRVHGKWRFKKAVIVA